MLSAQAAMLHGGRRDAAIECRRSAERKARTSERFGQKNDTNSTRKHALSTSCDATGRRDAAIKRSVRRIGQGKKRQKVTQEERK